MPNTEASVATAAVGAAAGAATGGLLPAALAVGQIISGIFKEGQGNARLKRLMAQHTDYVTPTEYFNNANMAMNDAQQGFGPASMKYFTSQVDNALSSSLGSLERMGGDPNDVAALFDRSVTSIMANEKDNELLKFQKFSKVYDTVTQLAEQKTAEYASKENDLKNKEAAAGMKVAAGAKDLQSGVNLGLNAWATNKIDSLNFKTPGLKVADVPAGSVPAGAVNAAAGVASGAINAGGYTGIGPMYPDWLKPYN